MQDFAVECDLIRKGLFNTYIHVMCIIYVY